MKTKIQFYSDTKSRTLRTILIVTLMLAVVLVSAGQTTPVAAEPPDNDDFPGEVIPGIPFSVDDLDVSDATTAIDDPDTMLYGDCNSNEGLASVWYSFTPVANIGVYLDTFGSSYDTVIAIWTGTQGNLSLEACNDDYSNEIIQSQVGLYAEAGTTYYIEIIEFAQIAPQAGERVLNLHINEGDFSAVDVIIGGGAPVGEYIIAPGESVRADYDLNSGPVEVISTNEENIITALLDAWQVDEITTSYAQIMGLPEEDLSTTYYFPAYNNRTLYSQLRFANVGTDVALVTVTIGGDDQGTYELAPSEQKRVDYDLNDGPVVVSSDGEPIVAALLDAWRVKNTTTSYIQTMGLPAEQLSTTYYFPSYNNRTLYNQIRFANVGDNPTTVTVTIGGVERGSYPLDPDEEKRVDYDLNSGPVMVSSSGEPIIAAILDAWQVKDTTTSYSQLMGLPIERLSTTYYFPAYNNRTLYGQLRIGNVGDETTAVTVTIGGDVVDSFVLAPDEQMRVDYDLNDGPVVVSSSGEPIITALLDAWQVKELLILKIPGGKLRIKKGTTTSYVQLMGIERLSDTYYFPAYNNRTLYDQVRIGAP